MGVAKPLLEAGPAGSVDLFIVAGEHSGDQHAARAWGELVAHEPGLTAAALGGPALAKAGVPVLHDMTATSVVGLVEVLKHYGFFKQLFAETVAWIREHQPKVVMLVDYPGFNLRLAKALKEAGISRQGGGQVAVFFYISPQLWAWKSGRRFTMAQTLDELAVIFPFETEVYADTTLPVTFVGHPFVAEGEAPALTYDAEGVLLLLPGSRLQPVRRILPVMLDAVKAWRAAEAAHAEVPLVVLSPDARLTALAEELIAPTSLPVSVQPVTSPPPTRAVLTSSGTMSLACALAGVPGTIVYRAHPLTYWMGRRLVKVPYLGIANLILERETYPEFIQGAAHEAALGAQLTAMMRPDRQDQAVADAAALRQALQAPAGATLTDRLRHWLEVPSA